MTRVLVIHSRYSSGPVSGENQVVDAEIRLLRHGGHHVESWTPIVSGNSLREKLRAGAEAVWSRRATAEVRGRIRAGRIEIVHCHNLFPAFSPAVILAAAREGAAVVMTLHNYRLLCLPATFMRDGRICEDCLHHLPWRGVLYGCYRDSHPASGALTTSLALHRVLGTMNRVGLFLSVSRFVRDKHVEAGLPPDRIRVKPHFAWPSRRREGPGDYFLYIGRLSSEKGVGTLVAAWRSGMGRLLVVGAGPELGRLRAMAPAEVDVRPPVSSAAVAQLIGRARAVLVPSVCYEGAGRVVLEAYAAGVPVLASQIGALPEVVEHGTSGLLVVPGQTEAWGEAVLALASDSVCEELGSGAWQLWRDRYGPAAALRNLEQAYISALS